MQDHCVNVLFSSSVWSIPESYYTNSICIISWTWPTFDILAVQIAFSSSLPLPVITLWHWRLATLVVNLFRFISDFHLILLWRRTAAVNCLSCVSGYFGRHPSVHVWSRRCLSCVSGYIGRHSSVHVWSRRCLSCVSGYIGRHSSVHVWSRRCLSCVSGYIGRHSSVHVWSRRVHFRFLRFHPQNQKTTSWKVSA